MPCINCNYIIYEFIPVCATSLHLPNADNGDATDADTNTVYMDSTEETGQRKIAFFAANWLNRHQTAMLHSGMVCLIEHREFRFVE